MAQVSYSATPPYAALQPSPPPHQYPASVHPPRITLRLSPHCRDYSPHLSTTALSPLLRTVGLLVALPPTDQQLQQLACIKFNFPPHFGPAIRFLLHVDAEIDESDYQALVRDNDVVYVDVDEDRLMQIIASQPTETASHATAAHRQVISQPASNSTTSAAPTAAHTTNPQQPQLAAAPAQSPTQSPSHSKPHHNPTSSSTTQSTNSRAPASSVDSNTSRSDSSNPASTTTPARRQTSSTASSNGSPELLSPTIRRCSTPGCGRTAQFGPCPECQRLNRGNKYFCSQECFERNFATHAELHHAPDKLQKKP